MPTLRSAVFYSCAIGFVVGCGGDHAGPTEPPPKPVAGISVISGANVTDTISTTLPQLLKLEVRGATGELVPGVKVRFTSGSFTSDYGVEHYLAEVADPTASLDARLFVPFYTQNTDDAGRVSVLVRLGTTAGTAYIVVDVPALSYVDTVRMTVTPGAPTKITVADTGVVVGGRVQLRATAVDRAGNLRGDAITFSGAGGSSSVASVTSSGSVTGRGIGQAVVLAQTLGTVDTAYVAVVPAALLAVYDPGLQASHISPGVATVNLDGSSYHWIASAFGGYRTSMVPAWGAAGSLLYEAQGPAADAMTSATAARLFTMTAGNSATLLNPGGTLFSSDEVWPAYSAATGTTYYAAYEEPGSTWRIWARTSGGAQTAVPIESWLWYGINPSPSPDGTRLAFISNGDFGFGALRVFDLQRGATERWTVQAEVAEWSPVDDRIAFVQAQGGPIELVNADGSNVRALTTRSYTTNAFSWSPDGKWIVAKSPTGSIDLVNASTGAAIPLRYLSRFNSPAWK